MQIRTALGALTVLAVIGLFAMAACDDRRARDREPAAPVAVPRNGNPVPHQAIQIGAFRDSLTAVRLRDSLSGAGWNAFVRPGTEGGRTIWRVRLSVGTDDEVVRLTTFALRNAFDSEARVVSDTIVLSGARAIEVLRVNPRVRGMLSRARWALSPDQRTVLVVDDPAGVENEPLPNGFVLAGETGMRRVQVDSAWDVSPEPGWRRAAFGRAYRISAGENETLSTRQFEAWARRIGMPTRDVRRGAFPVSAMDYLFGFARPGVVDLETGESTLFPVSGGWRIGWSPDGSRLFLGSDPALIADDAAATSWIAVDAATGQPRGRFPSAPAPAHVNWTEGPLIDISVDADTANRISLPVEGGAVESRGGWIRARGRVVGPGVLLATTRAGRFVVALVPNPAAGEYDAKDMLVVYTLSR